MGAGTAAAGTAALAQLLPAGTWLPPVRRALAPSLCGPNSPGAVALSFDDGPDPVSTPLFLAELDRLQVRATFFCVGERARGQPQMVREIAARGHQVAVHGWWHRNQLLRPGGVHGQLRRAAELIADLAGTPPLWYRPPYGVLSGEGLLAAKRLGLRPVLWTVWAKDWTADATPERVLATARDGLIAGATILLHDTDAFAVPGCWRATLGALPDIVEECRGQGLAVGTLGAGASTGRGQAGSSGSGGS